MFVNDWWRSWMSGTSSGSASSASCRVNDAHPNWSGRRGALSKASDATDDRSRDTEITARNRADASVTGRVEPNGRSPVTTSMFTAARSADRRSRTKRMHHQRVSRRRIVDIADEPVIRAAVPVSTTPTSDFRRWKLVSCYTARSTRAPHHRCSQHRQTSTTRRDS